MSHSQTTPSLYFLNIVTGAILGYSLVWSLFLVGIIPVVITMIAYQLLTRYLYRTQRIRNNLLSWLVLFLAMIPAGVFALMRAAVWIN
ncbi:MAG: hypothetical protein ACXAE3_09875 [Candidatus Kariarchaeaceae archaeon]|jgi:Mn2+/Fe2+ NRAMP family transporter